MVEEIAGKSMPMITEGHGFYSINWLTWLGPDKETYFSWLEDVLPSEAQELVEVDSLRTDVTQTTIQSKTTIRDNVANQLGNQPSLSFSCLSVI